MTKNCEHCGAAYSRPPSQIGRFCSYACKAKDMRRGDDRAYRRMRYLPSHPLAPPGGYVSEARVVLYEKVGIGPHPCHWCGKLVNWEVGRRGNPTNTLVADHLDSNEMDDSPTNLVPACGTCNGTRARTVGDDEHYRIRTTGTRLRGEARECAICGDGFVAWETRAGRGLYCSRSCARRGPRKPRSVKS